jgi:DNA-binding NarL/FixJ family response regulator
VAGDAFAQTLSMGCRDYFVCAYRGYPQLLELLSDYGRYQIELSDILAEARDTVLARRSGLDVHPAPAATKRSLTNREREVYDLLLQGLTNRDIAQALFISEATAKLHVRHILAKLGVRSRTEAAAMGGVDSD